MNILKSQLNPVQLWAMKVLESSQDFQELKQAEVCRFWNLGC